MCHNIYESEDFTIQSEETVLANLECDPPEKVNIVKKRITKAEYQDDRDDLGFLSHYIIDMACQDKLKRIEANEKTRGKELLERTCTYKQGSCQGQPWPCRVTKSLALPGQGW